MRPTKCLVAVRLAIVAVAGVGSVALTMPRAIAGDLPSTALAQLAELKPEHKGGTMRLLTHSAQGTIDPQINYTARYWQLYQFVYDGLLAFKKVSGDEGSTLVPDLAEAIPTAADEGRTYTFKLRKGIRFSNGKELTVKDAVASFQRIFKVSSPTSGTFYAGIVGADACLKEPASCTLAGGVVGDEAAGTITFHLSQPDPEFFAKLALAHASILPADTPAKDVGTVPIPGTGPYMFERYDPDLQLKIVRNPQFREWNAEAQPDGYPDEIDYDFGLTDEAEITAIENNQADGTSDDVPADRLGELGTKYQHRVFINTLAAVAYAPMNTNIPPFNNLRARLAVNYALDRNAMVNLLGGPSLASPTCQVLPPGVPGHVDYCPYTKNPGAKWSAPDVERAKQLVRESGTAGQEVTVIAADLVASRDMGTYLQSVLNEIGYKASIKSISPDIQFSYIQNTNNRTQISITQWNQDYPAASDFLYILLSCDSFHPGSDSSVNIAGFCDKRIDGEMREALKTAITDPVAANKIWARIDQEVTDQAPLAAFATPKRVDFVSTRVGNFQFHQQYFWIISQSWVK